MREEFQIRGEAKADSVNCKLKFNGTHLDWFRFWNQFESDIEKSELPPVSKFSYLKELVSPNVRSLIDGLPFTTEGYTTQPARNIPEIFAVCSLCVAMFGTSRENLGKI